MGWSSTIHLLALFWIVLHILHRVRGGGSEAPDILPTSTTSGRRKLARRYWKYELHHIYLRIETTSLNDWHDRLTQVLARTRNKLWRRAVLAFYDLGIFAAVLGQLFGILFLVYLPLQLILAQIPNSPQQALQASGSVPLKKRETLFETNVERNNQELPIHLILPGVTVPLWHLPLIVLALFACQAVHEAGHAICAAIESVPLLSVGASLVALLPAAHVALPSAAVERLSPHSRLRVISAGAFHNLVTWTILWLLVTLGFGGFLWSCLGYRSVGTYGRVVVALDEHSALHEYLPIGSIITSVDDTTLVTSDPSIDVWSTYLSSLRIGPANTLGWCARASAGLDQTRSCCTALEHPAELACFIAGDITSSGPWTVERCISALEVLRPDVVDTKRCSAPTDCAEGDLCMRLRDDEQITRLTFRPPDTAKVPGSDEMSLKAVVWNGPRAELLADVETSTYLPRLAFLPLGVPGWINTVVRYIPMLSLSLFFFNVLPLPYLDGAQLADALVEALQARTRARAANAGLDDVEAGAGGASQGSIFQGSILWPKYRRLKAGVQALMMFSMVISLLLGLFDTIRTAAPL